MRYRGLLSLLNRENLNKCVYTLRRCGWRVLYTKLRLKLGSAAVKRLLGDEPFTYQDACLYTPLQVQEAAGPVDIVVPVYNSYDYVCRCLDSVWKNTTVPFFLHVLDDCSSDPRIGVYLHSLLTRQRPISMLGIEVLSNQVNEGFVKTVNRGFSLSRYDVLILNTDTEVPPGWLERMTGVLAADERIASVTPFSNSATICSFPVFCADNMLPAGQTAEETDAWFALCNFNRPVDIPTGVGFCMLLRQQCLQALGGFDDQAWGDGYGEENDWCCRAAAAGWRNVLAPHVFVYHKHGVSFTAAGGKSRSHRIQSHLARLYKKYPKYELAVTKFVSEDPLYPLRQCLRWRMHNGTQPGILFLNHSLGGGTQVYQDQLIAEIQGHYHVYTLALQADGRSLVLEHIASGERLCFDSLQMDSRKFQRLLDVFGIQQVYVNQLISYSLEQVLSWLQNSGIRYTYFVHDFYCLCPSYNLIDCQGNYCAGGQDSCHCQGCIDHNPGLSWAGLPAEKHTIAAWRMYFAQILHGASRVAAPSRAAAALVEQWYPRLAVQVREHRLCVPLCRTFSPAFVQDSVLEVSLLGAISEVKGAKLLYELERKLCQEHLPIRLNVIGYTHLESQPRESQSMRITGAYAKEDGARLLAKYRTALVMILSIWPETFSYTTSEAMSAGYPVLCFDLGAPAERVRRTGGGWVLSVVSVEAVLAQLKYLLQHREEIVRRAECCQVGVSSR